MGTYVFLICFILGLFSAQEETKNNFVFLKILNDIRKNPLEYKDYIENKFVLFLENTIKKKNRSAISDLNNFLSKLKKAEIKELEMNFGLEKAAMEHSEFLSQNNKLDHLRENYITPKERVREFGNLKDTSYVYQIVGKFSVNLGNMLNILLLLFLENNKSVRKN